MDALQRAERNHGSVAEMNRCNDEINEEEYERLKAESLNEEDNPFI